MGKRIDQLKLDDQPIAEADPRDTDWGRFGDEIDSLLATGKFTWAEDTLRSIQETAAKLRRVTPGQRQAIKNIEDGVYQRRAWRRFR